MPSALSLAHEMQVANLPVQQATLSFRSISKKFGQVLANADISIDMAGGGIHAIVGENGAGKSTLTKILCGYYQPDFGAIYLNGKEVTFKTPSQARQHGIGMVHQQLALVPSLTGYENVLLGDPEVPFLLPRRYLENKVKSFAQELGFELDLKCPVSNLGIAERQKLEIFKLLWRKTDILILDEPTSQLTSLEAEGVLKIAQSLAHNGHIVILITHHIAEVRRFAKNVTVLRKGKCITTSAVNDLNTDEIANLMVEFDCSMQTNKVCVNNDEPLLALQNINTSASGNKRALSNINLNIYPGEIIGIAGITGSGQEELAQLIAGLHKQKAGKLIWQGKEAPSNVVSYIPSEQSHAYAPGLSIEKNCFLKKIDNQESCNAFGFVKQKAMQRHAKATIDFFKVNPPLADIQCSALSGGNLQKLIIARELSSESKIIVADNPNAGLDANTSSRVAQELRTASHSGKAVVLISPDIEELIALCDRIIVMFNGHLIGEQKAYEFDSQSLGLLMGGSTKISGN